MDRDFEVWVRGRGEVPLSSSVWVCIAASLWVWFKGCIEHHRLVRDSTLPWGRENGPFDTASLHRGSN